MRCFILAYICSMIGMAQAQSQTIVGRLAEHANQSISLVGFSGFSTYIIASSSIDANGNFTLPVSAANHGIGYLIADDNKPFLVILSGEDVELEGDAFGNPASIKIRKGAENQLFEQFILEHPRREQTLSAWLYLLRIYREDPLFANHKMPKRQVEREIARIRREDNTFLSDLPRNSFASWYLPIRRLVSSVSVIAQYRTEEIPWAITSFRSIDLTDPRLHKSGLLGDVIEAHFWLIENSGRSLDSVYIEMSKSIDVLVENLLSNEQELNDMTEYLFKFLEKRSLFKASEYLALKLLNERACTINSDFSAQLESYRAMKKGNIAPDFDFKNDIFAPGYEIAKEPKKLSDVKSKYTAMVFGASWCPQCPNELLAIANLYDKWKQQNIEVVFVSLDEEAEIFTRFAGVFPFISICDYQKWESPIVKSYHVFATPTIYLLDEKREILLRPNSVFQLDSWVDWYLVQGNR